MLPALDLVHRPTFDTTHCLQNTGALLLLEETAKEPVLILIDEVSVGVARRKRRSKGLGRHRLLERHSLGVISRGWGSSGLGVHALSDNGHGLVSGEEVWVTRIDIACLSTSKG